MEWESFGRGLIFIGLIIAALGVVFLLSGKSAGSLGETFRWFGRLPGDILVKRENFTFYFPVTTSILISIVLGIVLYLISLVKH